MNKKEYKLKSPVLFIVFNRVETTKKVFESIREAKPPRLYISSDGHRSSNKFDKDKIDEIRSFIIDNIDWDCEVNTLFNSENYGCKLAVYNAISWFFKNEEFGIILEDDCLPNHDFYFFCDFLLHQYADNKKVFSISGRNHLNTWKKDENDYFFTTGSIWGWASWRRAWKYMDIELKDFENFDIARKNLSWLNENCKLKANEVFMGCVDSKKGKNSSWAYPWAYARIKYKSLNIVPSKNLINNIGFSSESTHTKLLYNIEPGQHSYISPLKTNNFHKIDVDYINKCSNLNSPSIYKRVKIKFLKYFNEQQ
jgi:hypothetical protein